MVRIKKRKISDGGSEMKLLKIVKLLVGKRYNKWVSSMLVEMFFPNKLNVGKTKKKKKLDNKKGDFKFSGMKFVRYSLYAAILATSVISFEEGDITIANQILSMKCTPSQSDESQYGFECSTFDEETQSNGEFGEYGRYGKYGEYGKYGKYGKYSVQDR